MDTGAVWIFWGAVCHPSPCPASLTLKQDTGAPLSLDERTASPWTARQAPGGAPSLGHGPKACRTEDHPILRGVSPSGVL